MQSAEEEKYVFLRFADGDISYAIMAIDCLDDETADLSRVCVLQCAILAYCRPFKLCKTKFLHEGRTAIRLQQLSYVPGHFSDLHSKLMGLRDKIFVHTDLTERHPVLSCWTSAKPAAFPIQFRGFDVDEIISNRQHIRALFEAVLGLVRNEEKELELKFSEELGLT